MKIVSKKGQLQALAIVVLSMLTFTGIIVAENTTELDNQNESNPIECNVVCENSVATCEDGFVVSCSNTCNLVDGKCSICIPDCRGHEKIKNEDNISNELNEQKSVETNITETPTENLTIPESNEMGNEILETNQTELANQTESINITIINQTLGSNQTIINQTIPSEENNTIEQPSNETNQIIINQSIPSEENITISIPNIGIEILYPEKITRGEVIEIKAIVINSGSVLAKNVVLTWQLPEGFVSSQGSGQRENCGSIESNASCTSTIAVQTSLSTLGRKEVKVVVSYD